MTKKNHFGNDKGFKESGSKKFAIEDMCPFSCDQ